jgi:RNA polymerase sigma factor (sigma-70 family)
MRVQESLQMDLDYTGGADDASLAKAWEGGDERGYDALVTRYAPMVYARCRRALGAVDADDATQAVFLVLARKRDQAIASPALAAWLLRVAENVVCNARRDRARRRRAEHALPLTNATAEETDMDGIQAHLDACLAGLPAAEREAIRLHHLAGHTLAEVATHTGVPLSTVHDRVQRGLGRLRQLLGRRGITGVSAIALLACLQAEAAAAVPPEVVVHLHGLAPAAGGTGATAVPSARAQRWSQTGISRMTRIALVGAAALLVGGTLIYPLTSAEAGQAPPAASAQPAAHGGGGLPPTQVDPPHTDAAQASAWYILRLPDGVRTAARLRTQPEMALLPPSAALWLDRLATVRGAAVAVMPASVFSPAERAENERLAKDLEAVPSQERAAWLGRRMQEKAAAGGDQPAAADKTTPEGRLPSMLGWVRFTDAEAAASPGLRGFDATPFLPAGWTFAADAAGWSLKTPVNGARIDRVGDRLALHCEAGHPGTATHDLPDGLLAERGSEVDLEFIGRGIAIGMTVTDQGLRLRATAALDRPGTTPEAGQASPILDRRRFSAVPATAVLAAAVATNPRYFSTSDFWQAMIGGMVVPLELAQARNPGDPGVQTGLQIMRAVTTALGKVDGAIVAWVEPGMPLPVITVEADLAQPAFDELVAATGMSRQADGTATCLAGMVNLTLGWRDGRMTFTSDPGGLKAPDTVGGFVAQPEIQRALAAMPAESTGCLLVRPGAFLGMVRPFVGMVVPQYAAQLDAYQRRLATSQSYGYLTVTPRATGVEIDAMGLCALVAGPILLSRSLDAMSLLQNTN